MKKQWISILIVGLTFGTAWAVRGQFGHEQGAAWAAGIGAISLVLALILINIHGESNAANSRFSTQCNIALSA